MTQFKFDFKKTYKEVDVAGTVYNVPFDDDALARYQKAAKNFYKKFEEITNAAVADIETATDEEIEAVKEKQKQVTKEIVETFIGEGTFDVLYEKAGRSVANLLELVYYLMDLYHEETKAAAEEKRKKYTANMKR